MAKGLVTKDLKGASPGKFLRVKADNSIEEFAPANTTGTEVDLSSPLGGSLNEGSPSSALEYTVKNLTREGHRSCFINAASEPKIWTGNFETDGTTKIYYPKIQGADFVADTDMEMVVESKDGSTVRYFFLAL